MKTLLTFCTTALLLILTAAAPQNDEPNPQEFDLNNQYQTRTRSFGVGMFPKKGAPVMNLLIDNYSNKSISIRLKDKKGNVYYMEMLGKKRRRSWLKFNMSEMKDAVYQVIVFNGKDKIVKEINLRTVAVPLPEPQMEQQRLISMR